MGWTWVNDLMTPMGKKKDFNWSARCPYAECPGNKKPSGVNREEWDENLPKPKLKFVQVISPLVHQYRCGYCGCLTNFSVEIPDDRGVHALKSIEPALWGRKPSYKFIK